MKIVLSFLLVITTVANVQATTFIVSNVPGFPANYSNLQTCVDVAVNGDIIIVQGSGTNYGDIIVTKRLTIMGPGYFLNQNPQTQAVLATAKLNSIYFKNGSSGSILEGMDVVGTAPFYYSGGPCAGTVDNFSIKIDSSSVTCISNYWTNWIQISNSTGSIIKSSYGDYVFAHLNVSNLLIENTILGQAYVSNSNILNCLFGFISAGNANCFENCLLKNNIILSSSFSIVSSSLNNNIFLSNNPLGVNIGNNLVNIDPVTLFVGYPNQGGNSLDGKFRLKSNSPAIGAGEGGIDVGPFGGSSPYSLSGISLHPNIWFVNMPTIGTSGGGLQVQVKVNAND